MSRCLVFFLLAWINIEKKSVHVLFPWLFLLVLFYAVVYVNNLFKTITFSHYFTFSWVKTNVPCRFLLDSRYLPIRGLGRGAYGIVISAQDRLKKEKVAIKKIPRMFLDLVDGMLFIQFFLMQFISYYMSY